MNDRQRHKSDVTTSRLQARSLLRQKLTSRDLQSFGLNKQWQNSNRKVQKYVRQFPKRGHTPLFGTISVSMNVMLIRYESCANCAPVPSKHSTFNTTNLINHLKSHHKVQYQEFQRLKTQAATTKNPRPSTTQTTISGTLFNAIPYSPCSQRHKEITEAIAYHLAKDMCLTSTVSSEGFKKMIATLDKRYNIPSRNHFSKVALPLLYAKW